MFTYPPQYDELYVISDIHMGGTKNAERNFQIFNRGIRLSKLITQLGKRRPDDTVCLVLNGDIIDSLAEEQVCGYVALDHQLALNVLERIYHDPSFEPVWKALAEYLKNPRRHLVVIIGNHDIELSLPGVEALMRHHLTAGNTDAQSRLVFSTHGSGFVCKVGNKRVFCTHGNEVDDWNIVNYGLLGQLGNAMNAGRTLDTDKWKPNAGTRLVVDVMNGFKQSYPFVDLLKPEIEPVLSILLTLDNNLLKKIDLSDVFRIKCDKEHGELQRKKLLAAEEHDFSEFSNEALANEVVETLLGSNLREAIRKSQCIQTSDAEDKLLETAEELIKQGKSASDIAEKEDGTDTLNWIDNTLNWMDIIAGMIGLIDKVEALRSSLKDWLKDDTTFNIDTEDDAYRRIIERVTPEVDFVITGHTHLARAIEFKQGRYYFNCGTWIRLLRLTDEVLADDASQCFKETAWCAFTSGRMSALDSAKIPGKNGKMEPLLYDRTHVVRISAKDGTVKGDLLRVSGGDHSRSKLKIVSELDDKEVNL